MTLYTLPDGSIHITRCIRGGFHDDWSPPVIIWALNGQLFLRGEENADTMELQQELEGVLCYFEAYGVLPGHRLPSPSRPAPRDHFLDAKIHALTHHIAQRRK